MGTESFRLFFILLFYSIFVDSYLNVDRQKILLNSLFTHSSYPSIDFALRQFTSSQMDIELELNTTEAITSVCYLKLLNIQIFFILFFFLV